MKQSTLAAGKEKEGLGRVEISSCVKCYGVSYRILHWGGGGGEQQSMHASKHESLGGSGACPSRSFYFYVL